MDREDERTVADVEPTQPEDSEDIHPMDALLEEEDYELQAPRRGEIRTGTVARVTETDVLVDIGAKSEGVIPERELTKLPEEQRSELQVGEEITVYISRMGDPPLLSLQRAEEEKDWQVVENLHETQELYEGEIGGFNKGGLIVHIGRLRGFVPASQISISRRRRSEGDSPEKRWGDMVSEPIACKVIEVDRRRNRLILSERAAAREARKALKERLIHELEPGEVRTGYVISLADFGAFVDIGGADGLVHVSEISWKRISNPRDVLKVGQEVQVKVLAIDPDRNRISLSMKDLESSPWEMIQNTLKEGQLVEGVVTKLTKFGAFASITNLADYDIEGLIHISELSDKHIEHPREMVKEGQTLTLRVVKLDVERRRIGLSLKAVDSQAYAEQDLEAAMTDFGREASEEPAVEDFDAELEAEATDEFLEESPEEALETEAEAELEEVQSTEETELAEVDPAQESADGVEPEISSEGLEQGAEAAEAPRDEPVTAEESAEPEPEDDPQTAPADLAEVLEVKEGDEGSPPLEPDENQEIVE